MAFEICPHCQDFTRQTHIRYFYERRKKPQGVESTTKISQCHNCHQTIEHETIYVNESFPSSANGGQLLQAGCLT